jgi:hypothetical protein
MPEIDAVIIAEPKYVLRNPPKVRSMVVYRNGKLRMILKDMPASPSQRLKLPSLQIHLDIRNALEDVLVD